MRALSNKPKLVPRSTASKFSLSGQVPSLLGAKLGGIAPPRHAIQSDSLQRLADPGTGGLRREFAATGMGHDFGRIPVYPTEASAEQPRSTVDMFGNIHARGSGDRAHRGGLNTASSLRRICTCSGGCPKCNGEQSASPQLTTGAISAERDREKLVPPEGKRYGAYGKIAQIEDGQHRSHSAGNPTHFSGQIQASTGGFDHVGSRLGPRSDGLDDVPYIGPDEQPSSSAQLGPGSGTGMGCVTGPLRLVTTGALEGGYSVNDYLVGGLSWGTVGNPSSAGADGRGFKVQLCANFSTDTSLGVSQNFTFVGANQAFLDGAAQYLGKPAGSVTNGTKINEPVLNAGNPYAHTGWELQYGAKTGAGSASLVSFADVPRMLPGCKGSADFETCFYSRGGPCQEDKVCRIWHWTIDFTGSNNTNTVT